MKELKAWQLLDSFEGETPLPDAPKEMFVVNCFYCILKEGDKCYLPLVYPSYKYDDQEEMIVGGTWTPLYNATMICADFCKTDEAKIPRLVREEFDRYLLCKRKKIQKDFETVIDYLGLRGATVF